MSVHGLNLDWRRFITDQTTSTQAPLIEVQRLGFVVVTCYVTFCRLARLANNFLMP